MNYHLHCRSENVGIFPLEKLYRRRKTGGLSGTELVWCAGMGEWQPLDAVLHQKVPGMLPAPPPIPSSVPKPGPNRILIAAIVAGVLLVLTGLVVLGFQAVKISQWVRIVLPQVNGKREESALALASKPVVWNSRTLTEAKLLEKRGQRDPSYDADALGLIGNWIAINYGGTVNTNLPPLSELCDKLANNPACNDPLVLTVAGLNTAEVHEAIRRLERAVRGFEHSRHKAYPKLYATNEFFLGLGAFNNMNETVIRYRDLQVRDLTSLKQGR
jgi:hypothetical protein